MVTDRYSYPTVTNNLPRLLGDGPGDGSNLSPLFKYRVTGQPCHPGTIEP
jgi:hypothetical protein